MDADIVKEVGGGSLISSPLCGRPESDADLSAERPAGGMIGTTELARALASALTADAAPNRNSANGNGHKFEIPKSS